MVKALQMDAKKLGKSVNCEVFLDVNFFLAAATFESCLNHTLWFDELFEALFKFDAS